MCNLDCRHVYQIVLALLRLITFKVLHLQFKFIPQRWWRGEKAETERKRVGVKLNVLHFYLGNFHDFDSCQLARLDMTTLRMTNTRGKN